MADPEVIGDRQRYAEAGRLFNQLAPAAKLAEEWRRAQDDAAGAQELLAEGGDDPELREMLETARARSAELEEEIRLAMVERDPADDKNVIVEIRGGAGGEEAGLWAGDLYRMFTRYAERRGFKTETLSASDGVVHVRGARRRRVLRLQVRGRDAPRPARARDRVPGPNPHVDGDRRRAAGGGGGRRPGRPERPGDRRLPLVRPRRPVGQHDRLGGPDHAQADRHRRVDAGREVAAAEPRARDEGAARAALRGEDGRAAGRAGRGALRAGRHRRARGEDPHLQLPRAARHRPPHQVHRAQPRPAAGRRAGRFHRPRCRTTRSAAGWTPPPPLRVPAP